MAIDGLPRHKAKLADFLAFRTEDRSLLGPLTLVAATTVCLLLLTRIVHLHHVSILYIIPVMISATRWGTMPAIASAVGGLAASAFFFYPPIHDLRVSNPQQIADLSLFVCVAIVTNHLAESARTHMKGLEKRELELRSLYAFSRRLAAASALSEILFAVRDHLSAVVGHRILLFQMRNADDSALTQDASSLPEEVRAAIAEDGKVQAGQCIYADKSGSIWLVRAVSDRNSALGMVAIDLGQRPTAALADLRQRIDAALADAEATLERLDVAHAIDEARARSSREAFREALIGSVSHELRTPLAAILGAASVLSKTHAVAEDERLRQLTHAIHVEAERLDNDIRNLLDASRISSDALRARLAWTDPVDLVNAAIEWQRVRNPGHTLCLQVSDDLPLVHVDPTLVEQALRQVIDNACKYSSPGAPITIAAEDRGGQVVICVRDEGIGLTSQEKGRIFERFYRGPRHQGTVAGSGLGLWIARAFVTASGGRLCVDSAGPGKGTVVTVSLPAPGALNPQVDRNE